MPKRRMSEAVSRAITNMRGQSGVNAELAARGGMSRSDLLRDSERGPVSPIGHGTGSKKEPKKGEKR
jgi:hypothetical protein